MNRTLAFVLITSMVLVGPLLAEDRRTVSVQGHGEVQTEPDMASITLGIFIFDKDLLAAKKEADTKIASLLSVLAKMEVKQEDIRTTQLYVRPKYKEVEKDNEFLGYEITRSMTVTLRRLSKLNEALNTCIQSGANRIEAINTETSKEKDLKDKALALAISNARDNANRLATGFGAKLGKVQTISLGSRDRFGGVAYEMNAPTFGEGTYQPGMMTISTDLEVVFELMD